MDCDCIILSVLFSSHQLYLYVDANMNARVAWQTLDS